MAAGGADDLLTSIEDADARAALREARRLVAAGDATSARRWATAVVDLGDDLPSWTGASAVLARCLDDAPLARRARIAVLGSSTTSQLSALLPLACARAGLHAEVYEAPFGQYRQEILDPHSPLLRFDPDVVVLALHDGELHLPALSPDPHGAVVAAVEDLRNLWDLLAARTGATVVQFNFPVPPDRPFGHLATAVAGSRSRVVQEVDLRLGVELPPSVVILDCARLAAEVGARRWFDPRYWHLAKQAVSPRCVPLLARHTAAVIAASLGLSRKCLVLDLDGTLWGGVLGEDGIEGVRLGEGAEGEAYAAFQDFVAALEARGVVLAICSKNDEALVRDAFARHPGMRLRLDQFAVVSAGWDDKPAQLRRIAADLGLGLDALVLCDDNPIEREAVRQLTPDVDVIRLPTDPAGYVEALASYPYFESVRLTEDDTRRTEQYRARAAANAERSEAASLEEFLDSLDMEASVELVGPSNLARVAQLVGKTNQFNLTGRRRSDAELAELAARPDTVALAARLRDRFTDHGLVAVLTAVDADAGFEIDTWLMSCRVIGRSLEALLLEVLAATARERGHVELRGTYVPTAKNALVEDLYLRLGFRALGGPDSAGVTRWALAVDEVDVDPHIRLTGRPTAPVDGLGTALPTGKD